jgi:hypothetical protein
MEPSKAKMLERPNAEPPFREMLRIAEQYPDASLLQIIERIDPFVWQIEKINPDQKALYARTNGLVALRLTQARLAKYEADFPLNASPRTEQWLATGAYSHLRKLVAPELVQDLSSVCDRFLLEVGIPPVRVFDHPDLVSRLDLPSIVTTVLRALPRVPPSITPAILKKRTLLRRTFPLSRLGARVGNSNNQLWHQDSNLQYNDLPMLTLWVPLQNISDGTRPGLKIMDAPVAYFSAAYGDSSWDLPECLAQLIPQARSVSIEADFGDCIVFNGLTFHQTHTSPAMTEHRDALLIRVLDQASAHRFSPDDADEDMVLLA